MHFEKNHETLPIKFFFYLNFDEMLDQEFLYDTLQISKEAAMVKKGQGNFINGSFLNNGTITLTSENPSCHYQPVFLTTTDVEHVPLAIAAAKNAYKSWRYSSFEERRAHLLSLKAAFIRNEALMAEAISLEMGKVVAEALGEAKNLSARIDLMLEHGYKEVKTKELYHLRAETRAHAQGVLAVIGPYNFPAHLVNAHVIPSILLGNTVVIKPSEVCPMVAEIYAKSVAESSLPPGVVNVVNGRGDIGRLLSAHEDIDGVLFTGSYPTGRALKELLLDQPHKILALEMGGKNFAVVMDDADLEQALGEVINGAFLTTGQRCTATSRLLVHEKVFPRFKTALSTVVKSLRPCRSDEAGMFGPLATNNALKKFMSGLEQAKREGAEVIIESIELPNGAFVTPSLYQVSKDHPVKGYLGEELFGPNLCLESFQSLDQAIERINLSPFGLSNAIFTLDRTNSERMFFETKSGVFNINRSTNNSLGQMPFGGVNKSGNQRPAGIDAVKYVSFPVATTSLAYGDKSSSHALLKDVKLDETALESVVLRHQIEKSFEIYSIYSENAALDRIVYNLESFEGLYEQKESFFKELEGLFGSALKRTAHQLVIDLSSITLALISALDALLQRYASENGLNLRTNKNLAINVPENVSIPKSRTMLDRLYKDDFVPAEKKSAVIDLVRSRDAFLVSVDENPLVLLDAASQIATMGTGFLADAYQNAYDNHEFDLAILKNSDLSLPPSDDDHWQDASQAKSAFEDFLHDRSQHQFKSISYGASGAEANEIALDLCRRNGSKGTRILAFEGAFHGRTIMTLQATYNKEKRGPFAFSGFEAIFLPFPDLKNPDHQPAMPAGFLSDLRRGHIPEVSDADELLNSELKALAALKEEALKDQICAVIIEPMQCEGGDRYASNRFFSGLRALTRALKLPLIFDEVQTGFHLGREFLWYHQFNLVDENGRREHPDCLTLAKKAQLGVCLSMWENDRASSPHVIQLKRGLLHGESIKASQALFAEAKAKKELAVLKDYFPDLVIHPRACGFAFAFDMPKKELANHLIDQRFHYGFMAYIAGEKTLRFRLNTAACAENINRLFEKLFLALTDIRDQVLTKRSFTPQTSGTHKLDFSIERLDQDNFLRFEKDIERIENETYEKGRRDTMAELLAWLKLKDGIGLLAAAKIEGQDRLVGYAIGGPLEHSNCDGPKQDPHRGLNDSFYSANISLDKRAHGFGLGHRLKSEFIKAASLLKKPDGTKRYLFMASRNHVGHTAAMGHINKNFGGYQIKTYDDQYGDGSRSAYVRIPLQKNLHITKKSKTDVLDCQNSLQSPFHNVPESFLADVESNKLRSILGSKLTLSNWATPNVVRYSELLRKVSPKHLNHAYFTSGRDEVVDKGLRSLRFHRPKADIALGFSHQWLGNITAASRSLSHGEGQDQPFSFFDWPKIPHPALDGEKSFTELKRVIDQLGAERILGLVVELMGERSGLCFSDEHLEALDNIRKETQIPLVFVESASSFYRSGKDVFLSDHLKTKADMVWWYTGGQLGHIFVNDAYFVKKPLTLISTWDGDELSIARSYHNLLYANSLNSQAIKDFEHAMHGFNKKVLVHGQGVCYSLKLKSDGILKALDLGKKLKVIFGKGFDQTLMVMAKPDFTSAQFSQVIDAVTNIVG